MADIDFPTLPPAVPRPCNDCPWRRNAAPGWLGPYSAEEWIRLAHTETPIACHQTIKPGFKADMHGGWDDPGLRQCMGVAIYRHHAMKRMMNPTDAYFEAKENRERVFDDILGRDFIGYHNREDREGPETAYEQGLRGDARGGVEDPPSLGRRTLRERAVHRVPVPRGDGPGATRAPRHDQTRPATIDR